MSTVVGLRFIQEAPEDAIFMSPDLGPASFSKKFALFHAIMGRVVVLRRARVQ